MSHQDIFENAKPPRTGPAFLRLNSIAYRLEMLLITIILLVVLFYWRLLVVKGLNLLTTVFWIIFPDLASFIPIGLAMRRAKEWPRWGPSLYNFFHTFLVWIPVFAIWSIVLGGVEWPLLGCQVTSRLTALSDTISEPPQGEKSIRSCRSVVYLTGLRVNLWASNAFSAVSLCYHLGYQTRYHSKKFQNKLILATQEYNSGDHVVGGTMYGSKDRLLSLLSRGDKP